MVVLLKIKTERVLYPEMVCISLNVLSTEIVQHLLQMFTFNYEANLRYHDFILFVLYLN